MQNEQRAVYEKEFERLAHKIQPFDEAYSDLTCIDGRYQVASVQFACDVYLVLRQAPEESPLKHAFNQWREIRHKDSKNAGIFFDYVDHLSADRVTEIWHTSFDSKNRNIQIEHEIKCRMFVLLGLTVQQRYERDLNEQD